MRTLGHTTLAVLLGLAVLPAPACLVVSVDLRSGASADTDGACRAGERRNPASNECEPCTSLPPPPGDCYCEWDYRPNGFPYCDTAEAYYTCLTCEGSISSCNDLTPVGVSGVLGVTRDCARIRACCDELASDHPGRAECCPCGATLRCDPDPADPESSQFIVSCDPVPACAPACDPLTERCNIEAGCVCEAVPP